MAVAGAKGVSGSRLSEELSKLRRKPSTRSWGIGNVQYVSARVKAKKTLLLPKETYDRLLLMEIPEIARFLGEGEYKAEMIEFGARYSGVDLIETAITRNLARTYNQIYSFAEGRLREMIGLYLERYDLDNVKAIVRGKVYGAPIADIEESLLPAGELPGDVLVQLIEAPSVERVFELLSGTIFAAALGKLGKRPAEVASWSRWEDLLSQMYYERQLDSVPPDSEANRLLREFIQREIDVLNLKTLLRTWIAKARFDWEIFIDGGRELKLKDLHDLLGADEADLLKRLGEFDVSKGIVPDLQGLAKKGVGSVMRRVEIERLRLAERYSHLHPLSVLPVLDFILRKDREVQNLRLIARSKESGLSIEEMRALLVV